MAAGGQQGNDELFNSNNKNSFNDNEENEFFEKYNIGLKQKKPPQS